MVPIMAVMNMLKGRDGPFIRLLPDGYFTDVAFKMSKVFDSEK